MNAKPWLIGAVASLALVGAARAQDAAAMFHATTLNVSATGQIKAAPDQATLTLGVQTVGKTAAQAMAANANLMSSTIAALTSQGVQKKDIQTTSLNLSAQYAYEQNQAPRLTGYQASNDVSVVVHDVGRLGATIDAVTGGGANQINGIVFGLSDPKPVEDEARRAAVRDLRAKADLYAQAEGLRVIRLVKLTEDAGVNPGPRPLPMMAMARKAGPTPVEAGELNIGVQLSAVYELGN